MRVFQLLILLFLVTAPLAAAVAQDAPPTSPMPQITASAINGADLMSLPAVPASSPPPPAAGDTSGSDTTASPPPRVPDPAIVKLQVLLDRAGISPGVIDGFDGDNVRKAVRAFQEMFDLPVTGRIDPEMIARLDTPEPVVGAYIITDKDVSAIVAPIPSDYAEMAQRDFLGYSRITEELGERFHMDETFLKTLNPAATFTAGETIAVTAWGPNKTGKVARLEADKGLRQLRGYDDQNHLIVAYPATIGSTDNPSPTGPFGPGGMISFLSFLPCLKFTSGL